MKHSKAEIDDVPIDQHRLTDIQVKRLSSLSGVEPKALEGLTIADIRERFGQTVIDPKWLLFRKVCGRVVKKNPITGALEGVPFATVEVEDTDCDLISYFPAGWKWGWHFPFGCHREVIATVKTDACGYFCAWVPRFDIDYVLHWRHKRYCFPVVFHRPRLVDIIPPEAIKWPDLPPHNPGDPGPEINLSKARLEALAGDAGARLGEHLDRAALSAMFGGLVQGISHDLHARAFETEMAPPLPTELHQVLAGAADVAAEGVDRHAAVRSAIAGHIGIDSSEIGRLDPSRFIGPFERCVDVFVPEWSRVLDVPDITFKVLQDVNGDGVPETIYSEGYFDVRWDAGAIPSVTLVASQQAISSKICHTPDVPCSDVPEISFAGLMPLNQPAYFDATNGYALRPNRPKIVLPMPPHLTLRPQAQTPFCGVLQLYGCVDIKGASYYQVERSDDNGATWNPIVGQPRHVYNFPSGTPVVPAETPADGWYTILRPADAYHPAHLIIELPTDTLGVAMFRVSVGDSGKSVIGSPSAPVAIQMDNTAPSVVATRLAWRFASEPDSAFNLPGRDLLVPCPTIHRGSVPQDVAVRFDVALSAAHLRDAAIGTFGCGAGNAFAVDPSYGNVLAHWHTSPLDNTVALTGQFTLSAGASEGSYGFDATATSRAMNPSGGDGGNLADWFYDPVYIYSPRQWNVAVVNG